MATEPKARLLTVFTLDGPFGEQTKVQHYADGSIRFRVLNGSPMAITESFLSGKEKDVVLRVIPLESQENTLHNLVKEKLKEEWDDAARRSTDRVRVGLSPIAQVSPSRNPNILLGEIKIESAILDEISGEIKYSAILEDSQNGCLYSASGIFIYAEEYREPDKNTHAHSEISDPGVWLNTNYELKQARGLSGRSRSEPVDLTGDGWGCSCCKGDDQTAKNLSLWMTETGSKIGEYRDLITNPAYCKQCKTLWSELYPDLSRERHDLYERGLAKQSKKARRGAAKSTSCPTSPCGTGDKLACDVCNPWCEGYDQIDQAAKNLSLWMTETGSKINEYRDLITKPAYCKQCKTLWSTLYPDLVVGLDNAGGWQTDQPQKAHRGATKPTAGKLTCNVCNCKCPCACPCTVCNCDGRKPGHKKSMVRTIEVGLRGEIEIDVYDRASVQPNANHEYRNFKMLPIQLVGDITWGEEPGVPGVELGGGEDECRLRADNQWWAAVEPAERLKIYQRMETLTGSGFSKEYEGCVSIWRENLEGECLEIRLPGEVGYESWARIFYDHLPIES